MLDFNYLFSKYGSPIGIIHVSPQLFFARNFYYNWNLNNTIWIEPNPFFYQLNISSFENSTERLFNYQVDSKEINTVYHLDNSVSSQHFIKSKTLTQIIDENNINKNEYNLLHLGQSIISDYIRGCESEINNFKYISIEVSRNLGNINSDIKRIDKFMKGYRFKKVEIKFIDNIGHVYYVKKRQYNRK